MDSAYAADGYGDRVPDRRRWMSPTLLVLTAVSFTQDAASELLYPLLPIFLTGVLAAPALVLGVVEGVAVAAAGLSRYVAGRWSDGRQRKPFILAGYGMAAIGKVIVAAALVWPMVLVGRVVDRLGKGVRSAPRDALIAGSTSDEHMGRAFGFHRMGDSLGAVVGPLLGLLALSVHGDDVRSAIWWAVVPACLSTALVVLVRERRPDLDAAPDSVLHAAPAQSLSERHLRPPLPTGFWRVAIPLTVIALVNFSDALLLLRLVALDFSTTEVVLAYVLFNAVYTVGSYPAGAWADRRHPSTVYAFGLLAFSVAYVGLGAVGEGESAAIVLVGLYGLFPALTDGVAKAWVVGLVDRAHVGRAQGAFQGLFNGAVLIAGVWAGLLWDVGPGDGRLPLVISGSIAAVSSVWMMSGRWKQPHRVAEVVGS